jgi:hypothetical protein
MSASKKARKRLDREHAARLRRYRDPVLLARALGVGPWEIRRLVALGLASNVGKLVKLKPGVTLESAQAALMLAEGMPLFSAMMNDPSKITATVLFAPLPSAKSIVLL